MLAKTRQLHTYTHVEKPERQCEYLLLKRNKMLHAQYAECVKRMEFVPSTAMKNGMGAYGHMTRATNRAREKLRRERQHTRDRTKKGDANV